MDFPELPIPAHLDATRYKLYMADSGLLVSMLDEESQEDLRLRRDIGTWKGGLFENVVAEALVKSGAVPTYWCAFFLRRLVKDRANYRAN